MHRPLAVAGTLFFFATSPALSATGAASHGTTPVWPPEIKALRAQVAKLSHQTLLVSYPEAQLALAHEYADGGHPREALETASAAASAADRILELHKSLSETILPYEQARGERAAARDAGMLRDRATYFAATLAQSLGQADLAIKDYVAVVSSQPDTALAQEAEAGLKRLGFLASPMPAASAGSPAP